MQPEAIEYPAGEFKSQYRIKNEVGGFAGNQPRSFVQLKYVLPGLARGKDISYAVDTAIVLQQASIRNDLTALVHKITMKGIGLSERNQVTAGGDTLRQVADFVFDQVGLGSANGLVASAINASWYHVQNQIHHRIQMVRDGVTYGKATIDTFVLDNTPDLKRNGFPADQFDIPAHASSVIYSRIRASLSRQQVDDVFEATPYVNRRYDKVPRLILRANHPFSLYDNLGAHPSMTVHTHFKDNVRYEPEKMTMEIPLDEVQEQLGFSPKTQK